MTPPISRPGPGSHPLILLALLVLSGLLLWKLTGVLLLLFSAILLAAAFSALADGLRRFAPLPAPVAVLFSALLMFGVLAGVVALFGWRISDQYADITTKVRLSLHTLLVYARGQPWGQTLLTQADGARISDATDTLAPLLGSVASGAARYLTYAVIVVICAIHLALDPARYRQGALILVPVSHKQEVETFLDRCAV
uniref:AI-2E family transporter n=1 Tax=Phenylobacterium aquaticum TaxID=1763816 RepID=UPI0026F0D2A7